MHNIFGIFKCELRNLFSNVVTVLIAAGLALLPAIFTWFNVLACWDVFNNMGSLTVAVANSDEGYESSLFPVEVNVGEKVVSALRANDDIDWVITDEADALDGARAGRYYAAIVIPEDFSRVMLSFYADGADDSAARITYYTNEKVNVIAQKFTKAGADSISYQINQTFAETVSEVAIGLAEGIATWADDADAQDALLALAADMDSAATRMDEAAAATTAYTELLGSTQALANGSAALIDATRSNADAAADAAADGVAAAKTTARTLEATTEEVSAILDESIADAEALLSRIPDSGTSVDADAIVAAVDARLEAYRTLLDQLRQDPDTFAESIAATEDAIAKLEALRSDLVDGGGALGTAPKQKAQAALDALKTQKARFESDVQAKVQELSAKIAAVETAAGTAASALDGATAGVGSAITEAGTGLGNASGTLAEATAKLSASASTLRTLADKLRTALAAGDSETVRALLGSNASAFAAALSAPVAVERTAIYPVEGFGTAMTPFYATLGLFIGALVAMVAFRPLPSERVLEEVAGRGARRGAGRSGTAAGMRMPAEEGRGAEAGAHAAAHAGAAKHARTDDGPGSAPVRAHETRGLLPHEVFLGHFGVISLVAFAQSTILAAGNLLFLQVQAEHPFLLLLCFWLASQLFAFIMYALVVSFANLGKGIGVILLVMQVTGCGGSYPLTILPGFIQALSPLLPATHAVNAMRSAMFGFSGADYWTEMLALLAFFVPFLLLGLVLRKPTAGFMKWYVARVEDSKLMA